MNSSNNYKHWESQKQQQNKSTFAPKKVKRNKKKVKALIKKLKAIDK